MRALAAHLAHLQVWEEVEMKYVVLAGVFEFL